MSEPTSASQLPKIPTQANAAVAFENLSITSDGTTAGTVILVNGQKVDPVSFSFGFYNNEYYQSVNFDWAVEEKDLKAGDIGTRTYYSFIPVMASAAANAKPSLKLATASEVNPAILPRATASSRFAGFGDIRPEEVIPMAKASDILRRQHDQWQRVRVEAKVRLADTRDLPEQALRTMAAKKEDLTYFFQDGVNPDLVYVNFILDSEGGNANWDFMPRAQLIRSYATCRFKPFDMEHVIGEGDGGNSLVGLDKESPALANSIYGVMTHAVLADANGTPLTPQQIEKLDTADDLNRKPADKITVVAWAAMYNFLFPNTVSDMIDAIQDGDMKVSMERWMSNYDYMAYNGTSYESFDIAAAKERGLDENWDKHYVYGGKPVYRRALSYVYGGAASTPNPANGMAKFLGHSELPERAVACRDDRVLAAMLSRHTEIHETFDAASAEEKIQLEIEHRKLHLTIAAYTGQEVTDGQG